MLESGHIAEPIASPGEIAPPPPQRNWISLKTKGLLAFSALIFYAVVVVGFVLHQKDQVLGQVAELQRIYRQEELLRRVNMAVFHTVIVVNDSVYTTRGIDFPSINLDYGLIRASHAELVTELPQLAPNLDALNVSFAWLTADPSQRNLLDFANTLNQLVSQLAELTNRVREREGALTRQYRLASDSVVVSGLVLGLLGLVLFGAIISLFFTRLVADLQALQQRAAEIVKGYRGRAQPVSRNDEVGQLIEAVNHMAADLEAREKQLAMERQKYYHQEKMAAIGALATGVAHEIGNPIAAISGVAEAIRDAQNSGQCPIPEALCHPDLILEQISRLAQITRDIANLATQRPAERELHDLNELVRTTGSLMRYDKRFKRIDVELDLDDQLPAVYCVGDQITQVLMNLFINAADALEHVAERRRQIRVATRRSGDWASILVEDNGSGMDPETATRATEAFFTTKADGQGTGLGLALCKSIADGHRGALEIASQPGAGTQVRLLLPLTEEQRLTA
ncbi:MAG: GHKL domain-containing protein [Betaproteobacteria bacterium]|nr:GHKL domain-containing protein [Betaproteobacteria bacterium]